MRFSKRKKLAHLVMISASGSLLAAQTLPLLPVDPALLDRDVPGNPPGSGRGEKGRAQIVLPAGTGVGAPQATDTHQAKTVRSAEEAAPVSPSRGASGQIVAQDLHEHDNPVALGVEPVLKLSRQMAPLRKNNAEPGSTFIAADRI